MSVDVDLYKYNYSDLFNGLKGLGITDDATLEKILLTFGFRFGEVYIILCDEHAHESYNSYYNLGHAIDKTFGIEDSFDLIVDLGELLESHNGLDDLEDLP